MKSLFGLIGEKLGHSFSPVIHSIIFKELDIDGYYDLFEVSKEDLKRITYGFKALGVKGANVTIPYKVDIIEYLDDISHEAKKIGAVNTICFKGDKTLGYNTDYFGFGIMLDKFNIDLENKKAVILGSGGAAKSVLQYLLDNKIGDITLISRDKKMAEKKFKEHRIISYRDIRKLDKQNIIINSTPCGMYPKIQKSPVSEKDISRFDAAVDLVYNPTETLFLRYAKKQGLKAVNGLYMLVGQAVKAEELWNDIEISGKVIDVVYKRILDNIK